MFIGVTVLIIILWIIITLYNDNERLGNRLDLVDRCLKKAHGMHIDEFVREINNYDDDNLDKDADY